MKIEFLEIILVSIIITIQLVVFGRTFFKIREFKKIIPNINSLFITKIAIPIHELETLPPKEILKKISLYKKRQSTSHIEEDFDNTEDFSLLNNDDVIETAEINIIEINGKHNKIFHTILFSINNYLIRNRNASSDFNLIKDIVERNTNAVEEDINLSVGIPLYLGLMGTMIGIVIALFNMPDLNINLGSTQTANTLDEGIAMLIGGVKIAMIASFMGLMLTIINSGWIFKGSRSYSEAKKNELYTFIQIELLPIINQGLASTLESLQRNLLRFNDEFSKNLNSLSGVFDSNRNAIKEQKELLDTLDKVKISEITKYNVNVLKQLDLSIEKFEKFNAFLSNTTQYVENSQLIVSKSNELLSRTDNFKTIADNLDNKLDQSQQLLTFLSNHFNKLEEHKVFTSNTVADVGHSISEIFKELKIHIQHSSENIKQFTIEETDALKTALSESKTNLVNLEHLADLKEDVSQIKTFSDTQSEKINTMLKNLNDNMNKTIFILKKIENKKNVIHFAKNIFKRKNKK